MTPSAPKIRLMKDFSYDDIALGELYLSNDSALETIQPDGKWKLVAVSYTFQADDGTQLRHEQKHKDFAEDEEENE